MDRLGDLIIVDDDDERLVLGATGKFRAEVLPGGQRRRVARATKTDELVEFYDPTDIFGDLADALAEAFPNIAPEPRTRTRRAPTTRPRRRREGDGRAVDEAEAPTTPTAEADGDGDGRA